MKVSATITDEAIDQCLNRASRHQRAEAGLDQAGGDSGEVDHRVAPSHVGGRQFLGREAQSPRHGERVGEIGIARGGEEQDAGLVEDRQARGQAELFPLGEAVGRHAGVDFVLAVGGAGHPRFAARTSTAMRRAMRLDQRYLMPRREQMMRGPRPEHARADHRDMGFRARRRGFE